MADTGQSRSIARRADAREAETVRESKKTWSDERSMVKETDAVFGMPGGRAKARQSPTRGKKQRSAAKAPKQVTNMGQPS
jgi:hypothetical protein